MLVNLKKRKGIALPLIIGIIALLVIIVMGLIVALKYETISVIVSSDLQKAAYLADCGINKAIAGLKTKAGSDFIWSVNDTGLDDTDWYDGYSCSTLLSNLGSYNANIIDCSNQIYVNGDNTGDRLEDMLNILGGNIGGGCSGDEGTKIINNRPTAGYETKKQLRIALTDGEYNAIKDYVTICSYVNSSFNRAPINVNTAKQAVLETVLEGISGISDGQAATAANAIMNGSDKRPFSDWSGFDTCIDGTLLTLGEKQSIKDNCNPNSTAWNSTTGAYEHTSDTTEFCFHAGGYFEIESEGTFYQSAAQSIILARKNIATIVHTHSVFNKTTKADFTAGDTNFDGTEDIAGEGVPIYGNVNWLDSCPVDSSDETGLYSDEAAGIYDVDETDKCKPLYDVIPGSIKLGFWDNCDEENDNTAQTGWSWEHWIDSESGSLAIVDRDSDGDYELSSTSSNSDSHLDLLGVQPDQWNCGQKFSIRLYAHLYEEKPHPYIVADSRRWGEIYEDEQQIEFVGIGGTPDMHKMFVSQFRCVYWGGPVDISGGGLNPPDDFLDTMLRMIWDGGGGEHYVYMHDLYSLPINSATLPADGNRILPWNVAMRLVVDGSGDGNYTAYLAVDDGGAYHEWYAGDGGEWIPWSWRIHMVKYDADDHDFHIMTDVGDTDRYDCMNHDQSVNKFIKTDWFLRLRNDVPSYSRYPIWDDVRIIPDEGYYQSPQYSPTGGSNVEWGAINWTLTMPDSASSSSETAEVEVDTGSGFSPVSQNGSINAAASSNIKYKVTLKSTDTTHKETPVFEDITVIYLPQTKVLYRSGQ